MSLLFVQHYWNTLVSTLSISTYTYVCWNMYNRPLVCTGYTNITDICSQENSQFLWPINSFLSKNWKVTLKEDQKQTFFCFLSPLHFSPLSTPYSFQIWNKISITMTFVRTQITDRSNISQSYIIPINLLKYPPTSGKQTDHRIHYTHKTKHAGFLSVCGNAKLESSLVDTSSSAVYILSYI